MQTVSLRNRLIGVLSQIQADSGLECPALTGTTKPAEELPMFDSKVWPVATTILAMEIGATIPNHVNIFVDETTKRPRSIDETVAFVWEMLNRQCEKEAVAA